MVSSNDVSRLFLQTMISRRVVSDKLARVLWGKCVEAVKAADEDVAIHYDPKMFDQYVNDLNNRLEPVELKLASTVDEIVGKKLWALRKINVTGDGLVQVATDYSPVEIAYFKALVEQIVLASSASYSVSSMTALREVNNLKPSMSKTQAEVVLADFVAKGWLVKSTRGRYSLSSRTLMELDKYLKENYEDDIHECDGCHRLLTMGIGCYFAECSGRLHNHCHKQFVRSGRKSCLVPGCKADWSQVEQLVTIGEGAVREGQDSSRKKRVEENDETDETEASEEIQPKPKSKSNKKGKGKSPKGKRRFVHEEAEEDGTDDDGEMAIDVDETTAPQSQARRRKR